MNQLTKEKGVFKFSDQEEHLDCLENLRRGAVEEWVRWVDGLSDNQHRAFTAAMVDINQNGQEALLRYASSGMCKVLGNLLSFAYSDVMHEHKKASIKRNMDASRN